MRLGLRSLQWRIAAWTALILLAFQVGGLFMFERIGRSSALAEVRTQLDTGERVFARLLDQRSAQLTLAARVLAADYGLRQALASADRDTIVSALDNHGSRIGAGLMMLVGLDGRLVAAYPERSQGADAGLQRLLDGARTQGAATAFQPVDGVLHQLVAVPVLAPVPVAWVVIGFAVDRTHFPGSAGRFRGGQ